MFRKIFHINSTVKYLLALILIIIISIFLRAYHFSDWLKFNSDQARDAGVVRNMIENGNIPLLGPVAGGTLFQLGPAFYYFQYLSAKIFGATPDKMAYPDLFFGILSIPLLYLLAQQYFKKNISLILSALYAVAYFTVQYSRFAWNPNSAQFFSMLFVYCVLRLYSSRSDKKSKWIILTGISLGISIQLHALLLFGMLFASLVLAIYLFKNQRIKFSGIALIALIVLILNSTQFASEIKNGGANFLEFKNAIIGKSTRQSALWRNSLFVFSCQAQANVKILVPYADQESCDFPLADKYFKRLKRRMNNSFEWLKHIAKIISVIIFSGGGYWLLFRKVKKNNEKREFFMILILFNLSLWTVFAPFGAELSLRYFILLAFMPFLLLGLWLEFILRRNNFQIKFIALIATTVLLAYNLFFCLLIFHNYSRNIPGNMIDGTANQAETIADYIIEKSGNAKKIQISGQKSYLGRFYNRISYFAKNKNVEMILLNDVEDVFDERLPLFVAINEMSGQCKIGEYYKYGYIKDCKKMYDVTILRINRVKK